MKLVEIKSLYKNYEIARSFRAPLMLQALRGVDLQLNAGETLAIVGESGCGKSTLAKLIMKLESVTSGQIFVNGRDLIEITQSELPNYMQMVFQDPSSSLNPRKKVFDLIAEPLRIQNKLTNSEITEKVHVVAKSVSINPEFMNRYAHMMSGGQRQRVGIARALVTQPKVIILDEPVSALDVSVQAQVLNLLLDLREKEKLSYIFISHDLSVVRFLAHRVAVLYLGKIVEIGSKKEIFQKPKHPYTQLLLNSAPQIHTVQSKGIELKPLKIDELPSPLHPPPGCAFASRCNKVSEKCLRVDPQLEIVQSDSTSNWSVACHHVNI